MNLWPRRRIHHEPQPSDEAREAVQQAKRALRDTERLAERVDEVAMQLAEIRERNHFAAAVARAIRGV